MEQHQSEVNIQTQRHSKHKASVAMIYHELPPQCTLLQYTGLFVQQNGPPTPRKWMLAEAGNDRSEVVTVI